MNLVEMQILFHQIIEDTNLEFWDSQRPIEYNVTIYLNQAVLRYVHKKYLPFSTYKENHKHILENEQDLQPLIKTTQLLKWIDGAFNTSSPAGLFIGDNASKYRLPDDFLFYIDSVLWGRRDGSGIDTIMRMSSSGYRPNKLVSHAEAHRFYTTEINHPILREPVVFMEEQSFINLIVDEEASVAPMLFLTYVKKPFTLDFNYVELETLDSTYIGKEVRLLKNSRVYYPFDNYPNNGYLPGERITVFDGYYTLYPVNIFPSKSKTVGFPHDATNECELPVYQHEDIVRLAVQMFLDEAKLKLLQKAQA